MGCRLFRNDGTFLLTVHHHSHFQFSNSLIKSCIKCFPTIKRILQISLEPWTIARIWRSCIRKTCVYWTHKLVPRRVIRTSVLTVRSPRFLTRQCRKAVAPNCTVMLLIVLLSKLGSVRRWNSSKLEYHSCCHSACRWGSSRLPAIQNQPLSYIPKQDMTCNYIDFSIPERTFLRKGTQKLRKRRETGWW